MAHQHSCWLIISLYMRGVLAGDWSVHIPSSPICAVVGSSVVLPCSYDYPLSSNETRRDGQVGGTEKGQEYRVLFVMWCLEDSRCITQRYVFHSAGIFPDPSYQNRVQYLGQPGSKNCSLRISDLRQSDSGTYVFYLITNHPTEKMPRQRGIQLLVAESAGAVAVLASPSGVISEGEPLRLACCSPAAGSQSLFRWYKSTNNSEIHVGRLRNTSEVTPGDSGSYYCQIQTGGKLQKSAMLTIDVQYPPRNTAVSIRPAGGQRDTFLMTLTCSSEANPPVLTYTWYQGEACLPEADRSFHQAKQTLAAPTGRGSTLSSANITTEHYGEHCCVARNRHGSQIYSVMLKGSRETPSHSSQSKAVLIGVTVGILLAIIATVVFLITRRQKTSRHHSYVLTETTATKP